MIDKAEFANWNQARNVSDRVKRMVAMRVLDGLTLNEVGHEFGISGSAVRVHEQRALRRWSSRDWHAKMDRIRQMKEMEARDERMAKRNARWARWETVLLTDLPLTFRTKRVLRDFETMGEVAETSDASLLRIPEFGKRSLKEIRAWQENLQKNGAVKLLSQYVVD